MLSRLESKEKVVSLTFDDGPSLRTTPKILQILKKYHVRATFFVLGQQVNKNPAILKMILDHGHALGNHSYTHPEMILLSKQAQQREFMKTKESIEKIVGDVPIMWFRPPYGAYTPSIVQMAKTMGMHTVLWSIDPKDWKKPSCAVLQQRVLHQLKPGAIILLHDIHQSTAQALDGIIRGIMKEGYKIVPLTVSTDF